MIGEGRVVLILIEQIGREKGGGIDLTIKGFCG